MKKIPLTRGKFARVDDEDFAELVNHKWHYTTVGYAGRRNPDRNGPVIILMHRVILKARTGQEVDHVNHDKLDNRRENIRITNKSGNSCNRPKSKANTSGFKGVTWDRQVGKWKAYIKLDGKQRYLGWYDDKIEAHCAYWRAAQLYFGEFAHP